MAKKKLSRRWPNKMATLIASFSSSLTGAGWSKSLQPCWFNVGLMERPTVGSTSVNHRLPMQTLAQPSMSVVTPSVQPKDGWANGNGWPPLAGPLSNRSPNLTVGSELRERSATSYVGSTSTDHKK
ncbi:uncharacterized protein PGTG_14288 [Puccinia graminis f. sp. tritici CRL 75-36-700-3]|uniref:Uncharacterized protein n=2 Tax=Puccinia graminis f. sp. tritici TaxID=56615 RepID=E3KVA9_PUCGT|nr:uncharacterized protein PGTG_14288 [Puccinia graminis f. sp. tritici CRL 75-36-700-3]EFP88204.2 hypothetical protein PGTG_14288 [Puccinia graminis f. sp. tritici CRL 75-36-700-3]